MIYYVIEFQSGTNGAALVNTYTDPNQAYQKYHEILAAAAASMIEKHGAMIIDENLNVVTSELGYRATNSRF